MKIKFKGNILNIQNKDTDNPRKNFYITWNHFNIYISKDKDNKTYDSIVISPLGETIVENSSYKTMTEAVQDAFNNIGLNIDEKRNMVIEERSQLLQDGDITEEGLEEIEYWYGNVIKKYF